VSAVVLLEAYLISPFVLGLFIFEEPKKVSFVFDSENLLFTANRNAYDSTSSGQEKTKTKKNMIYLQFFKE